MNNVTSVQIVHQLLLNGKTARKYEKVKIDRTPEKKINFFQSPVTMEELQKPVNEMKSNKAAGLD